MKIKVVKSVKTEVEIEVEFPLYLRCSDSFDSGGWYETEMRITAKDLYPRRTTTIESIKEGSDGWEISTEIRSVDELADMLSPDQYYYTPSSPENYAKQHFALLQRLENMKP